MPGCWNAQGHGLNSGLIKIWWLSHRTPRRWWSRSTTTNNKDNNKNTKVNRILVMFVEVFLNPFEQKENGECIKITDMVIFPYCSCVKLARGEMGRNGYTSWADNQWIGGCNSPTWANGETKGNIRTLVRKMKYNSDNLEANQEILRDQFW